MRARFIVTLIRAGVPIALSVASIYVSDIEWKTALAVIAFVIIGLAEYVGIFQPLAKLEETKKKLVDPYIKPWVDKAEIEGRKPKIRVNVMTVKWHWFRKCFFQYYQYKMDGYPDSDLYFPISRGFCGQVLANKLQDTYYKDLRGEQGAAGPTSYSFNKKQIEATRHVKAVTSTPLFRKKHCWNGRTKHEWFAVMNVDAVDDAGAEYLGKEETLETIRSWAEFMQTAFE